MKRTATLIPAIALTLLAACNTADGVKKDADQAAEKTAEAARSTSDAVAGGVMTSEIKAALMADSRVDASGINVDTDEDKKTVTLNGTVRSETEKQLADSIASAKATDYRVTNKLEIKPKP
jgi:osmotically-inducible protein OsmY